MTTTYSSWKDYASGACSIRVKWDVTDSDGTCKITATLQRWDKYATIASGSYSMSMTSCSTSSGNSFPDSSSNEQTRNMKSLTYTYSKTTSTQTVTVGFSTDEWFDTIGDSGWVRIGSVSASFTYTIGKKTSYAVKYAANGGSSTPSSQTKWYGTALTLAAAISRANAAATAYTVTLNHNYTGSTNTTKSASRTTKYTFSKWKATNGTLYAAKASYTANAATTMTAQWMSTTTTAAVTLTTPTRNGYTFDGWATSSTGSKAYSGGASMTPSGNTTLYARWNRTVSYSANGGSGAPSAQTALATSAITLSSTKPTRTGYKFTGWNTQANGTGTAYASGGTYAKQNPTVTLHAQWQILLTVSVTSVTRCQQDGTADPLGTYAKVAFSWSSGSGSSVAASFTVTVGTRTTTVSRTAASGTEQVIVGTIAQRTAYTATVSGTVSGSGTSVSATKSVPVTYTTPTITSVATNRVDSDHKLSDEGTILKLDVKWSACSSPSQSVTMTAQAVDSTGTPLFNTPVSLPVTSGVYSGTNTYYISDATFDLDENYTVTVTLKDALDVSVSKGSVLSTAYYPLDILGDGYYYQPTTDSAVVSGKSYYAMGDSGWYELVENPVTADIASYCEKTGPRPGHGVSFGEACKSEGLHIGMTTYASGNIMVKSDNIDRDGADPSSDVTGNSFVLLDKDDEGIGIIRPGRRTGGRDDIAIIARNENSSGNQVENAFFISVAKDGTCSYSVSDAAAFREAIAAASQGYSASGVSAAVVQSSESKANRIALIYDMTNNRVVVDAYENGAWKGRRPLAYWNGTKNMFLATPSSAAGATSFRAITSADCSWLGVRTTVVATSVDKTISNQTWTDLGTFTVKAGCAYIGTFFTAWNAHTSGAVQHCVNTSVATPGKEYSPSWATVGPSSTVTRMSSVTTFCPSSDTTYHFICYQSNGGNLTLRGYSAYLMRIA